MFLDRRQLSMAGDSSLRHGFGCGLSRGARRSGPGSARV